MRVLSFASCSLASLAVCNLNQGATAMSNPESSEQPTMENTEDVAIAVENLPESVPEIVPPEVMSSSPSQKELVQLERDKISQHSDFSTNSNRDEFLPSTSKVAEEIGIPTENHPPNSVQAIAPPEAINNRLSQRKLVSSEQNAIAQLDNPVRDTIPVFKQQPTTATDFIEPEKLEGSPTNANDFVETPTEQDSIPDFPVEETVPALAEEPNYSRQFVPVTTSPEVITTSPSWSTTSQDSATAIEPVVRSSEALLADNSPVINNQPFDSDEEEAEGLDSSVDGLGEIQIIRRPGPSRQPDVQVVLQSSVLTQLNTTLFVNGAQLLATPKLGPKTRLIASAEVGRVSGNIVPDYNFLNLNLGARQQVVQSTYVQLGYLHENFGVNNNIVNEVENSVQLIVDREDQLATDLRLDSFYEMRLGFRGGGSFVKNTLGARLRYDVTPKLETALDSRIIASNQGFASVVPQVSALATYRLNKNTAVTASASYLINNSISNNLLLGLNVRVNLF